MGLRVAPVLLLLIVAPVLTGCFGADEPPRPLDSSDWTVGDRWVYLRTSPGASGLYVREVTSLFEKRGQEVFEVTEGLVGHPIQQFSLYTVGKLRFMGMEVREGDILRTRMDPESPLTFHYLFPHEPGTTVHEEGRIRQTSGNLSQLDTLQIEATAFAPTTLRLDERIYEVHPYEIRIRYTTTPFDDVAVIRGHWSQQVGQSVLTTVTESGETRTYELLSFTRARPLLGGPAYDLVDGLTSRKLVRGFDATLDTAGYTRHLFHVEEPTTVGVRFSLPAEETREHTQRMDLVAIRPLGYARAGVAENVSRVAEPGVVLHLAASRADQDPVVFHSPHGRGLEQVRLEPGHVYELLVASNVGPVRAAVVYGPETQRLPPVERGDVSILAVTHKREQKELEPGPQNVRDRVQAIVAVPPGARVEGLVYAVNHGGEDESLGEIGATRRVTFQVNGSGFTDPDALFGYYLAHDPRGPFTVEAAFEYRADMALRGVVDYEVGALLLRLVPPGGD